MSEDSDGNEWDMLLPPSDLELDTATESLAGDDEDPSAPLACNCAGNSDHWRSAIHLDSAWLAPCRSQLSSEAEQSQLVPQCGRGICLFLGLLCAHANCRAVYRK